MTETHAQRCRTHSSEKNHIFKLTLIGITAQNASVHRITFMALSNLLISLACFSNKCEGNTLLQNVSSRPNET